MSEAKCSVCGEPLVLDKEKTYLVKDVNFFTGKKTAFDAIDCEKCGCQNILKARIEKNDE